MHRFPQDPRATRLPPFKSPAARDMAADQSNANAGKALLVTMLQLAQGFSDGPALGSDGASGADGEAASGPYPAGEHWLLLSSCLDRISTNWFSRLREHMNSNPLFWVGLEHFPMVLCKCQNFRRHTISMLTSAVVPDHQKQAIAEALLRFSDAGLYAQIGYLAKVRPAAACSGVGVLRACATPLAEHWAPILYVATAPGPAGRQFVRKFTACGCALCLTASIVSCVDLEDVQGGDVALFLSACRGSDPRGATAYAEPGCEEAARGNQAE